MDQSSSYQLAGSPPTASQVCGRQTALPAPAEPRCLCAGWGLEMLVKPSTGRRPSCCLDVLTVPGAGVPCPHTGEEGTRGRVEALSTVPRVTATCRKLQHPRNCPGLCQDVSALQKLWTPTASRPHPSAADSTSASRSHVCAPSSPFCFLLLCKASLIPAEAAACTWEA